MNFHAALDIAQVVAILLFAVICHEYAHGWVAYKLGDPTAKLAGRLTLNPLKHIDPVGSIVIPFLLKFLGLLPLGWAKPVPVNFERLRHPKRDMIWVAMAGPATNVALALLFSQLLRLSLPLFAIKICVLVVIINLILAIFNLVPIPPLDGSRIVMGLLPDRAVRQYSLLEPFGVFIVIVLLNFGLLDFVWIIVEFLAGQLGVMAASSQV